MQEKCKEGTAVAIMCRRGVEKIREKVIQYVQEWSGKDRRVEGAVCAGEQC